MSGDIRLGRERNDMTLARNPQLRRSGAMSATKIADKHIGLPLHQGILSQNFKSSPYKVWSSVLTLCRIMRSTPNIFDFT